MSHSLTADNRAGNQLAIFVDGCFAATNTFILGVMRVDILYRAKDALTKQAVAFWLLGTVINSLWLGNLAVTPLHNVFRTSNS